MFEGFLGVSCMVVLYFMSWMGMGWRSMSPERIPFLAPRCWMVEVEFALAKMRACLKVFPFA